MEILNLAGVDNDCDWEAETFSRIVMLVLTMTMIGKENLDLAGADNRFIGRYGVRGSQPAPPWKSF